MNSRRSFRKLHDADLGRYARRGNTFAILVDRARAKAATFIRIALARTYGRGDMCTSEQWHVVPCLTDTGTLGILDIAHGTAWDTGLEAPPEVVDLGVEGFVYAGANNAAAGLTVKTTDHDGQTKSFTPAPKAPEGWQQILLPTWRGWDPNGRQYTHTPPELFTPDQWVEPKLVANELMTCYGEPGRPRTYLTDTAGWDKSWPHGLPSWVISGFEAAA